MASVGPLWKRMRTNLLMWNFKVDLLWRRANSQNVSNGFSPRHSHCSDQLLIENPNAYATKPLIRSRIKVTDFMRSNQIVCYQSKWNRITVDTGNDAISNEQKMAKRNCSASSIGKRLLETCPTLKRTWLACILLHDSRIHACDWDWGWGVE